MAVKIIGGAVRYPPNDDRPADLERPFVSDEPTAMTRRTVIASGVAASALTGSGAGAASAPARPEIASPTVDTVLTVNGRRTTLSLDPRTTLLDALREHVGLTGTKKGCDHGQCGACTVMVEGRRINACLTLAVMHDGEAVTTIEGLGRPDKLHPMQAAFVAHDGFQCGYCTPGQICSAVAMLEEIRQGVPSHVTADLDHVGFSDAEVRERMSGNICRCAAYPNIVAAIRDVAGVRA
jgi:xanthine dehydrogenase YagT iron-sulfur-binding subunit